VTAPTLMGFFNAGGSYSATIEVADAGPPTQRETHAFSWQVTPAVRILTGQGAGEGCGSRFWSLISSGIIGQPYRLPETEVCRTNQIRVTGGSGATGLYRYAVTAGRLPQGLCLQTATGGDVPCPLGGDPGTITGTPEADEEQTFTITVTDTFMGLSDSRTYRIVTRPPAGPLINKLRITTASLPFAAHMQPYSATLTLEGGRGPYTWSLYRGQGSGSLPLGLTLSSDGVISGTPFESGWTWEFEVQVRDSEGQEDGVTLRLPVFCDSLLCWGTPDLSPPETE
jgi:large repetitive protein